MHEKVIRNDNILASVKNRGPNNLFDHFSLFAHDV